MVVRFRSERVRGRRFGRAWSLRRPGAVVRGPGAVVHGPGAVVRGPGAVVRALVVVGLVVPGLAACADDAPPPPHVVGARTGPVHVTPQVGDCWGETDYGVVVDWAWWKGAGPVDCAGEHTSVTIAVGELPADFVYEPVDGTIALSDEQMTVVARTCEPPEWAGLGLEDGSRVKAFWYLPSPRAWADGERWVRCDVAVAAFGPLHPMTPEPLPADLEVVRAGIGEEYRLCLDTPHPESIYGPWYDPEGASAASCSEGRPQWELGFRLDLPDGPFPGEEALLAAGMQQCQELLNSRAPERWGGSLRYPDESTWAQGRRSITCWLR